MLLHLILMTHRYDEESGRTSERRKEEDKPKHDLLLEESEEDVEGGNDDFEDNSANAMDTGDEDSGSHHADGIPYRRLHNLIESGVLDEFVSCLTEIKREEMQKED